MTKNITSDNVNTPSLKTAYETTNFDFNWTLTPLRHNLSLHKACHSPLFEDQHVRRTKLKQQTEQSHCQHCFTFLAMHSGKSVFILCGKRYILAIKRQFLSLQQGKNHSQKLRWPSFLISKLTNLPLIACWTLLHGVQSWAARDVIHVIRWMRGSQIVPEARFFEQRAPI